MRTTSRILTFAAALALAGSVGGMVLAQSAPPAGQGPVASFVAAVAQNLGVTPARMDTAIQAAELAQVNALSQSHKMSAARAKALTALIDKNPLAALTVGLNQRPLMAAQLRRAEMKAAVTYIGLTGAAVRKDHSAGQSLAAIATAQGKTAAGLVQAMLVPLQTRLAKAVAAGHLTTTQEQAMLSHTQTMLDTWVAKA